MDKSRVLVTLCLAAVVALSVGCGADGEARPTPTTISLPPTRAAETPVPATPTLEPTAEPTETPSATPAATGTPQPTATPTEPPATTPTSRPDPPAPTPTPGLQGRFVFQVASGGDIYTVNADGTGLARLTQGMDPSWSADGSQVAFSRWTTPWGIYVINGDGTNERLVFSSNVARSPVWSPNGSQIAFYFETEGLTAPWRTCIEGYGCFTLIPPMVQQEWHLGVVDMADGYLHQPYSDRFAFSPTWSADGQWILYNGDHGLSITMVEGPNNMPFTDNVHDQFPVWSPDGSKIAFMHWQHDHWEIYLMNADGSGRWPLTGSSALLERRPNNVSPAWSPDGDQIVFLSDRGGDWEFYVMNADGTNQRKILENVTGDLKILYRGVSERVISWTR